MAETVRNEFSWGVIEWLAGAEVGNSDELSLARMSLHPGHANDLHRHGNCEESVYVVSGTIECMTDGSSVTLATGENTVVARSATHLLRNVGSEPAELLLSYSSAEREFSLVDGAA